MSTDLINDPVFWSFFMTTTTAFLFGIIKVFAKSKCKSCSFCGCKIERDTALEEKLDEMELQKQTQSSI